LPGYPFHRYNLRVILKRFRFPFDSLDVGIYPLRFRVSRVTLLQTVKFVDPPSVGPRMQKRWPLSRFYPHLLSPIQKVCWLPFLSEIQASETPFFYPVGRPFLPHHALFRRNLEILFPTSPIVFALDHAWSGSPFPCSVRDIPAPLFARVKPRRSEIAFPEVGKVFINQVK